MKLILFFSLLVAVYAHGNCGGDCLKACRSCGALINDGEPGVNGTSPFYYGCKNHGDCKEAICLDPNAVMIVDGEKSRVICFQGEWHHGYPKFLEPTASAMCLTPGNFTCDDDASVEYSDDEFKCVCKANYLDVTKDFGEEPQYCSNCVNKKLNVILLIDSSGSMASVLGQVKTFIRQFVKFLKLSPTGNRLAIVTSAFSYEFKLKWEDAGSTTGATVDSILQSINADGQSYLGSGMEAVKAALVQPEHDNDEEDHKLIVFTDGSVKHSPPAIFDITEAAYNLETLKVETFVVATNADYSENQFAIANGVENNVFRIKTEGDNMDIVNKLQKRICIMNFRTVFLFAIVGLLLVSSLDAAKAKGGKGKKGSAEKGSAEAKSAEKVAKVEKNVQKEKPVKAEKAKVEKPVKVEKVEKVEKAPEPAPVVEEEAVVVEESAVAGEAPTPKIYRPKTLKVVTAYDKCKMDCQKIRDQQDLHSYATQLRDELAAAEAALDSAAHLEEAPESAPAA